MIFGTSSETWSRDNAFRMFTSLVHWTGKSMWSIKIRWVGKHRIPSWRPRTHHLYWLHFMKKYWVFNTMDTVPATSHVSYLINRVLQSARDVTLAIRLKNDLVASEGDKINEVILVRKIVDRFFQGTEIAPTDDIPMWAAVHSATYCWCHIFVSCQNPTESETGGREQFPNNDRQRCKCIGWTHEEMSPKITRVRSHQGARLEMCTLPKLSIQTVNSRKTVMPDWLRWGSGRAGPTARMMSNVEQQMFQKIEEVGFPFCNRKRRRWVCYSST